MSTLVIAKKDFQDGIRSRALFLIGGLFTEFMALLTYFIFELARSPSLRASGSIEAAALLNPVGILVPILGTMLGYNAIVGERESGSLKFLLGLPHTRRDVVLGKLIGRAAIVTVTVLVGFAVIGIHFAVLADSFSLAAYTLVAGKMVVIGVVFVAIGIAFSAAARSSTVATWGAVGTALLFAFLWDVVLFIVNMSTFDLSGGGPDWFYLLERLNPRHAFKAGGALGSASEPAPFYLDPWFGVVILGGWLVVPLGLAYLRFQRGDLV